jgi:hypothetical protein
MVDLLTAAPIDAIAVRADSIQDNPFMSAHADSSIIRADAAALYAFKHTMRMLGEDPDAQNISRRHKGVHPLFPEIKVHADSGDAAFMLLQLTSTIRTTYDVKYPDLIARKILPLATEINPGAEAFRWGQYDRFGQAQIVSDYAKDFPNVEVLVKEFWTRLVSSGASFQYSIQDIRRAAMSGVPLETNKANACRRAMEELVERITCTGFSGAQGTPTTNSSDAIGIYGIANFPTLVANIYNTSVNWLTSSVAAILADLNYMQQQIYVNSKGIHKGTTLLVSTKIYAYLATTQRSVTFTDDTLAQYIIKSSPWLEEIMHWPMLDLAGRNQANSAAAGRMVLFQRSPENAALVIPLDFEQLPPQPRNAAFVIPCHIRLGGITMRYPLAFQLCDGAEG